jgi:hypothetical protein
MAKIRVAEAGGDRRMNLNLDFGDCVLLLFIVYLLFGR